MSKLEPELVSEMENDILDYLKGFLKGLHENGMFRYSPGDMDREQRIVAKAMVVLAWEISERLQDRIAVACYDDKDQRAYNSGDPEWTENLLSRKIAR